MRLLTACLTLAALAPASPASPASPGQERGGEVILVAGTGSALAGDAELESRFSENTVLLTIAGAPAPRIPGLSSVRTIAVTRPSDTSRAGSIELESREVVSALEHARAIVLAGGDAYGWWEALRSGGRPSAAQRAIVSAHRAGATVVGVGGAARYLASTTWIARTDLEGPSRNPRTREREQLTIIGLGLAPHVYVGVAGASTETALVHALEAVHVDKVDRALVLIGEIAWRWNPRMSRAQIVGSGTALLVGARGARRGREEILAAELALLLAGDTWRPDPDRARIGGIPIERTELDALLESAALAALAPAQDPLGTATVRLGDEGIELEIELQRALRSAAGGLAHAPLRVAGLPAHPAPTRR